MKLYVYDHCPFCTRARMAFALTKTPYSLEILSSDDEKTPISMIGVKMLPILEDKDGYMGESLDIVHKIDAINAQRLFDGDVSPAIADWLEKWVPTVHKLVFPRMADPIFDEFKTQTARDYFNKKKEASHGPFAEHLAATDHLIKHMEAALQKLAPHVPDAENPCIDDIMIFPWLRNLTLVDGLTFPEPVQSYMTVMAKKANVPLLPELRQQKA